MKKPAILTLTNAYYACLNRNLKRVTLISTLLVLANLSYGQGKLLNKLVAKVAKKAGNANVVSTATLDDIVPTSRFLLCS